ncbi:MAG TPA: DUF3500 domain-containing protein [Planctomycetota bacterium]|nr:DUF3500 domain-containing protein [Planctomycetota bacterium]
MNQRLFVSSGAFLLLVVLAQGLAGDAPGAREGSGGARIVKAAAVVLEALGPEASKAALFDSDSKERFNWHFIPRERKGIPLKDLDLKQREKVLSLLDASLSAEGAKKARQVMSLEDVLREIEGPGRRFPRDPLLYYLSFFGKPSADSAWGWRLEGHHLALNFSLKGEKLLSATPAFHGANPATVKEGPRKGERVLAAVEDLARELVTSLDEAQLKSALGTEVPDEVPGAETPRYTGTLPAGIVAERLTGAQRKTLRKLIEAYTSNLSEEVASSLLLEGAEGGLEEVHFAWRGGLKPLEGHSYMLHGPRFLINYANFQNGAAHIHSCLRTPKGEFGIDG